LLSKVLVVGLGVVWLLFDWSWLLRSLSVWSRGSSSGFTGFLSSVSLGLLFGLELTLSIFTTPSLTKLLVSIARGR